MACPSPYPDKVNNISQTRGYLTVRCVRRIFKQLKPSPCNVKGCQTLIRLYLALPNCVILVLPTEVLCDSVLAILYECSNEPYITSLAGQSTSVGSTRAEYLWRISVIPAQQGNLIIRGDATSFVEIIDNPWLVHPLFTCAGADPHYNFFKWRVKKKNHC